MVRNRTILPEQEIASKQKKPSIFLMKIEDFDVFSQHGGVSEKLLFIAKNVRSVHYEIVIIEGESRSQAKALDSI